jgi:hypothetical protein
VGLEDVKNLATGDALDEGDSVLVTEHNANLRRHLTHLRGLHDHLLHIGGGVLEQARGNPLARQRRRRDTLLINGDRM